MRPTLDPRVERGRVDTGPWASTPAYGCNGVFVLRGPLGERLRIIVSNGGGWEHASVTLSNVLDWPRAKRRVPTWEEMVWVKGLFWQPAEAVVQYHPAETAYVNNHPYCLHLWRPIEQTLPTPPLYMV